MLKKSDKRLLSVSTNYDRFIKLQHQFSRRQNKTKKQNKKKYAPRVQTNYSKYAILMVFIIKILKLVIFT